MHDRSVRVSLGSDPPRLLTPRTVVLGAAAFLALVHVGAEKFRFISYIPRSRWLSFAGGVSVAYVFIHLLPEISRRSGTVPGGREDGRTVWLLMLVGLVVFYVLERWSRRSSEGDDLANSIMFWTTISSYGLYNAVIAYLLHERMRAGSLALLVFVLAMALHFLVNDFALRDRDKKRYCSVGRWALVAAMRLVLRRARRLTFREAS